MDHKTDCWIQWTNLTLSYMVRIVARYGGQEIMRTTRASERKILQFMTRSLPVQQPVNNPSSLQNVNTMSHHYHAPRRSF